MLYPALDDLLKKSDTRYALVIATAKRAREISETETKSSIKAVTAAVNEIANDEILINLSKN